MKPRTLAITALSASALLIIGLIALMFSVYLDTPRASPFNANFALIDDQGRSVDQSIFKGHPSLIYFGYTHCPDACPTTLYEVTDWLTTLGDEGRPLKAYFFSIDPERDTQDVMHDYVTAFGDRITGVTGPPQEMKKVAKGWFIHAEKQPADDGNYHMNHTVDLLLVGADGRLKGLIPYRSDKDAAISKIRSLLLSHAKSA